MYPYIVKLAAGLTKKIPQNYAHQKITEITISQWLNISKYKTNDRKNFIAKNIK